MTEISDNMVEMAWRDLLEKDDRTSPAEYPDMALITREELRAALQEAAAAAREEEREACARAVREHAERVEREFGVCPRSASIREGDAAIRTRGK